MMTDAETMRIGNFDPTEYLFFKIYQNFLWNIKKYYLYLDLFAILKWHVNSINSI